MKKTMCVLLAAAMLLALCACGGGSGVKFKSVSASLGGGKVTILSAESFLDYRGRAAVRFYYDFTNNGDSLTSADAHLSYDALEDGVYLTNASASTSGDVPEYGNASRLIEPGVTIRCVAEFSFKASGRELVFTISDADENELTAVFDAQNLPGRPGEWLPDAVGDPKYYQSYPSEIATDAAEIAFTGAERQASDPRSGSADVITVSIEFTNLGSEPTYFDSAFSVSACQDGITLELGDPAVRPETYGNGYVDIASGESITVTRCWKLLSDSPVEIAVTERQSDTVLCAGIFPVA